MVAAVVGVLRGCALFVLEVALLLMPTVVVNGVLLACAPGAVVVTVILMLGVLIAGLLFEFRDEALLFGVAVFEVLMFVTGVLGGGLLWWAKIGATLAWMACAFCSFSAALYALE